MRRLSPVAVSLLALVAAACTYPPPELPAASASLPEARGLSWFRRGAIELTLDWRVFSGARSGYVALIARDGHVMHGHTAGYADIESQKPMAMDTRFRIASMTKPVVAVAAMILVEEGRLALDDRVSLYLPAFAEMRVAVKNEADPDAPLATVAQSPPMTVRHLLSFSSGIGGGFGEDGTVSKLYRENGLYAGEGSLAERIDRVAGLPLYEQPGERWRYGWSMDVVARIVEVASGEPLDAFLESRIFAPLGMRSTSYPKSLSPDVEVATLYMHNEDGDLVPSSRARFHAADWTPGGSGLVSTAPDYMRFALMLWNGGSYDGTRILSAATIAQMSSLVVPSGVLADFGIEGLGFGLGVSVVADEEATLMTSHNGDFWWSGAFGTHFWVSPSTGVVIVVLQQNAMGEHSGRPLAPFIVQALAVR